MQTGANLEDTQAQRFLGVFVSGWLFRFAGAWFVLIAIGWLAYALLRAFATIIRLDVPFFDWQWYIPVIALLIVVPICLTHRVLHRRSTSFNKRTLMAFAVLLIWAIIG